MAPQPLSRVNSTATIDCGINALRKRPILAATVLETISRWASIETWKALLLSTITGLDDITAISIYQAVQGPTGRAAMLSAAIRQLPSHSDQSLCLAVLSVIRTSEKRRHHFAHRILGISPDIEDALLSIDPKNLANSLDASRNLTEADWPGSLAAFDRTKILVFTEQDLLEDAENAGKAELQIGMLCGAMLLTGDKRAQMCDSLSKDQQIQKAIQALSTPNSP